MPLDSASVAVLRAVWEVPAVAGDTAADYELLRQLGVTWAARTRDGLLALVIPLSQLPPGTVGRRASGCELLGHPDLRFAHHGREWHASAASLICTDPELVDAFAVLAADISVRLGGADVSWTSVLAMVEEWQTLLAPRGRPSAEAEIGLWGELWFIERSRDLDRALRGWRGPDGDATDFFVEGMSAEVKTTRQRRRHHVSQSQVEEPVGTYEAWLLSLWVKTDPAGELTVPRLAAQILSRASDPADAQRRLGRAGYSPGDRMAYSAAFVVLGEPEWFCVADVPCVRAVDPGVSQLRYRVSLDEAQAADMARATALWWHFHGREYGGSD